MIAPIYRCRLLGWLVQPVSVEPPIHVRGRTWLAWRCPVCDRNERTRRDADYDPSSPGVHYLELTT